MSAAVDRVARRLGAGAVDRGELRSAVRAFGFALEGQRRRLAVAALLALAVAGAELVRPWPMKVVVDEVTGEAGSGRWGLSPQATVAVAAALTLVVPLVIGLLDMRLGITVAEVGRTVTSRIRHRLFVHLHQVGLPFHRSARTGDLLMRLTGDISLMRDLLVATWVDLLGRVAVLVGTTVVLFLLDPVLALLALAPLPFVAIGTGRSSSRLKTLTRQQRRREGAAAAHASESLRQIMAVKAYGAEDRLGSVFAEAARRSERAGVKAAREAGRMSLLTEGLTGLGSALVLLAGARRAAAGAISAGDLIVAVSYTRMLYKPLRKMSGQGGRLAKATGCAHRLVEILEVPPEPYDAGVAAPRFRGQLTIRGLWAGYEGAAPALRGLDLDVAAGDTVVIEGPNGAGKSTLFAVVLRLLEPQGGEVLIDGRSIGQYRLDSYRASFAYVPQDLLLFGVSVADNIRFGSPDASDEEVAAAAEVALFDEVAARMPEGFDTVLGESGASLSGGEARRLMLARAAVRTAPILLLDEPLAGLDPRAADLVCAAVERLAAGRTTIVIHHGDPAVFEPDRVVTLRHGVIEGVAERRRTPSTRSAEVHRAAARLVRQRAAARR